MISYHGVETAFISSVRPLGHKVDFATSLLDFLLRGSPLGTTDVENIVDRVLRVPAGPGRVAVQDTWFAIASEWDSGVHLGTEGSDEVDVVVATTISGAGGTDMSFSDGEWVSWLRLVVKATRPLVEVGNTTRDALGSSVLGVCAEAMYAKAREARIVARHIANIVSICAAGRFAEVSMRRSRHNMSSLFRAFMHGVQWELFCYKALHGVLISNGPLRSELTVIMTGRAMLTPSLQRKFDTVCFVLHRYAAFESREDAR